MTARDQALAYAALGWYVFPLHPKSKAPATENGFHDATTDLVTIGRYWDTHPLANVGLATGARSGFWVLDIDPEHGGFEGLEQVTSEVLRRSGDQPLEWPLNARHVVETRSGGLHLYYVWPWGATFSRIISTVSKTTGELTNGLAIGVDVLGNNGYVVAPPSEVDPGKYSIMKTVLPGQPLGTAPRQLLAMIEELASPRVMAPAVGEIRAPIPGSASQAGLLAWLATVQPGGQDQALSWVVRALRDEGVTAVAAADMLWDVVRDWPTSGRPWTERDIRRHINSAYK